jgi:hypothetical protein
MSAHVFGNGDLDWDFYINAMLDKPSSVLGKAPFRHGTDNNLILRVRKDAAVEKIHKIVVGEVNRRVPYDQMHNTIRTAFDAIVQVMGGDLGLGTVDPRKVYERLDGFGFDVSGVHGAVFFLFTDQNVKPSPIVKCSACGTEYDLIRDTQIITWNDLVDFLKSKDVTIIDGGGTSPALLQKTNAYSQADRQNLRKLIGNLRSDSSLRWSCASCKKVAMGYPGSLIAYDA